MQTMDEVKDEVYFCLKCKATSTARIQEGNLEHEYPQQLFTKIMSSGETGCHKLLFLLRKAIVVMT